MAEERSATPHLQSRNGSRVNGGGALRTPLRPPTVLARRREANQTLMVAARWALEYRSDAFGGVGRVVRVGV